MGNLGGDLSLWMNVGMIVIISIIFFFFFKFFFFFFKAKENNEKEKAKRMLQNTIIFAVLEIFLILLFYFSYGSGRKTHDIPVEKEGTYKMIQSAPPEDSLSVIKKKAYESKPEYLKKQDSLTTKEDDEKFLEEVQKKYK